MVSLVFAVLALHPLASTRRARPGSSSLQTSPVGAIISRIVTSAKPDQSYALYLPTSYSPARRWPIVYVFDPGANGGVPVEIMRDAAERYGYIVVGSNNSRNGSWPIQAEAAEAMLQDTQERFSVDHHRIYFAGFSGGARVAASIAQLCKCAAGVLLNSAGFTPDDSPTPGSRFAVFSTVGTINFNYGELVRLDDHLEKLGYPHFLLRFEGPHQWASANVMEEAFAWFRLQAMKTGLEVLDASFVATEAAHESQRAAALEQSRDSYYAWKEYRQASEMLAGIADDTSLRARTETLEKDKAVREGAKRERQEFEDQEQLTHSIYIGLSKLPENQPGTRMEVEQQILDLRGRTEHEKRPERLRVLQRSLAGVLGVAMDTGMVQLLDKKDVSRAIEYFELACDANPDSVWALTELAVARVSTGNRKGALEALRHARSKTTHPDRFRDWLNEEPAFSKLRGTPEFAAILEMPPYD